jgi:hypothetical protein
MKNLLYFAAAAALVLAGFLLSDPGIQAHATELQGAAYGSLGGL